MPRARPRNQGRPYTPSARCRRARREWSDVTRKYSGRSISTLEHAQHVGGAWSLHGQRRVCSDTSPTVASKPRCVLRQPAQRGIGRCDAERCLTQPRHGPVVDDVTLLVAPGCVEDPADVHSRHVTGDDAVDEPGGVTSGDEAEQRRDVDQRRRHSGWRCIRARGASRSC